MKELSEMLFQFWEENVNALLETCTCAPDGVCHSAPVFVLVEDWRLSGRRGNPATDVVWYNGDEYALEDDGMTLKGAHV